ncbi:DNA repair protein RAD50 [Habropoda laboriosa]|uniref:DNA repair protein RAD50 n=1 Tax=Habropoda laboriosa TaxID=597456 RepID=A0A0L7R1C0_9HYME|nr:DNA repair protein RAD50 [Habropoda laboriosa]
MSRIRRLSIRGIRNFGDDNDEALIRFSRPLTLILGPNGTGKTTIIEALKFATCGEFPPGSDRGKFFIHDPTLSKTSSVRGVVRAEIIDATGNLYTICRVIESTKTNVSMKFKTLDSALSRVNKDTKECEERLKAIGGEESTISNILANERVTNGSLRQQIKDQQKKVAFRNKILNETLSAWNLDTADSNISEIEVIALSKRLEEKMRELEHKVEENRIKREQEEKELQKTLGTTTNKLHSIESKIEEVKITIQQLNETMDADAVKKEIIDNIKLRNEMEMNLNIVDEEIASLLKQNSLQSELELNKSTLLSKEEEIQKLKSKYEEAIMNLLDIKELSQTKLKSNLDVIQEELVNEIESINRKIQIEEHQLTTLETTISHNERELQKKRKEIDLDKEKISSICDYKNFDEALLLQSKMVKDLQDKRGMYAHKGAAYKEYMKELKETNPCCPLCHRSFDERETVVKLLKEMENEMKNHPNCLKECEKELKIQREKYDKMLQLKPIVEKIMHFEQIELEKLKNHLQKSENRLRKSRSIEMELKQKKLDPENKLTMCKDIIGVIILWDRYIDEIIELKQIVDNFQTRMIAAGIKTGRSLGEAQTQRDNLKMSLKNIRDDLEKLQSRLNTHNEKIHNARQEQNALHEEQLKIRTGMQKLKELKDRQEALYSKEISLGKLVNTLRQKVTAAESELNSKIDKLERKKKDNREKLEMDIKLLAEGTRRLSELQKVQDEVDAFVYSKIPEFLECSEMKIKNYEKSLNELLHQKNDIETTINKLKEEISRQEVRKRELSDNLTLRKVQETTNSLQQQCLNLKERLNVINYSQVIQERQNLLNQEQTLLRQKNIVKGNQEELEKAVQQYTHELKREQYRQARKSYKNKCIELTVVEEAILNLKAYSRVLDTAMIEYHEERMATVNRIMKQMWRLVYTGTDTSSIEIRTDATQGIGSARRTYNYKLVQTKHGHEMDMKGRCSAGQKVLASIIIRLALAETFCKDCGILALDEPTTNLDQENADSLANALAKVVKLRSQHQKNFQLIVISHDEKFVFKLAELSSNKGFYQLYRKNTGYTAIRHCLVENQDHFASGDIKEEASSDEEINEYSKSRNKVQSEIGAQGKTYNDQTRQKKRQVSDTDNEDHTENRASKKRYVFQ